MFIRILQLAAVMTGLVIAVPSGSANPLSYKSYATKADFADVILDLKDSVINNGLVIDYTGNVDTMLSRTSDAVGSASPYKHAKYMQFCSAKLTNAATSADPANMAICPYVVFAYETTAEPGVVQVGYRKPIGSASKASLAALANIETLLDEIVKAAVE